MTEPSVVRFGVFEVDLHTRELRKRGIRLKLQDQPFQVLQALLERPGELVSREELQRRIWGGNTFVDFEQSLNRAVNKAREALGDQAGTPRFIETLPRRGYRFIAAVEVRPAIGQYRLREEIGRGAMGIVYRAEDQRQGRIVAVKVLAPGFASDPDRKARLMREVRAASMLDHPNIATVYGMESEGGLDFIVMELATGQPLGKWIEPTGMPLKKAVHLAVQVADGLSCAHGAGAVHGDLKPGKIMVSSEGGVKLLGFGLSGFRRESGWEAAPTKSSDHEVTGTTSHMSPEQVQGKRADARSDIFSLGAILYEMVTGRRAFPVTYIAGGVPPELERIISKAMEKDPARRYPTVSDLRDDLRRLMPDNESNGTTSSAAPSVAVLPFSDLSRDLDEEYFCDGIAEEISNALCRIQRLRVASPIGAFQFRSGGDPHEIGRRLLVGTLVEGSVRRSGSQLRIAARLTDVGTGYQLWSGTFDREMTDIFAVQQEIARNVAQALELTLTAEERRALDRVPTTDVRAYDDYLRGRKFYYLYTRRDVEFAIRLFTHAAELEPGYVLAHAGLADCWSWLYLNSRRTESDRQKADESSVRAVMLDPSSAQAQASRALALSLHGRHAEAEAAFEAAVRLDPGLFEAHYFYARYALATGRLEKAAALFERTMQVRPEEYTPPLLVAQIYDDLGRTGDARESRQRGVQLALRHLGRSPDDVRALYFLANGLVGLGERERGLEWAERALGTMPDEPMVLYNLGCIYSMLGRVAEAVDCLKRAVAAGLNDKGFFEHDSNLDPLRNHLQFQQLLASL